jgi:hypothetical protein
MLRSFALLDSRGRLSPHGSLSHIAKQLRADFLHINHKASTSTITWVRGIFFCAA